METTLELSRKEAAVDLIRQDATLYEWSWRKNHFVPTEELVSRQDGILRAEEAVPPSLPCGLQEFPYGVLLMTFLQDWVLGAHLHPGEKKHLMALCREKLGPRNIQKLPSKKST